MISFKTIIEDLVTRYITLYKKKEYERNLSLYGWQNMQMKQLRLMSECVLSKFNGTSTPKGSFRAKTGDNGCNVNSSRYSLSTALCESIRYQAKSGQT